MPMSPFEELQRSWPAIERRFLTSPAMCRVMNSTISVEHYAAYLRETYFYTREDPQIQAAATAYFRGPDRQMVKLFYQHASSEIGHDQMALNDLERLGYKTSEIPNERSLPATQLMMSLPYFTQAHRSPAAYLGYLFFLEFMPTANGQQIAGALTKCGVPIEAMTFLKEHQEVDVHHNRLMKIYADHMIRDADIMSDVIATMAATGRAFALMLDDAFETIDSRTTSLIKR